MPYLKKIVVDTNVLLQNPNYLENFCDDIIICPLVVIQELDRQKSGDNGELAYKARGAIRWLKEQDNINFQVEFERNSMLTNDDVIVQCAIANQASLLTGDFNMQLKGKANKLEVIPFDENREIYKGYRVLELACNSDEDSAWLQHFYESPEDNSLGMNPNEYLIIRDTDSPIYSVVDGEEEFQNYKTLDIRRWNGSKFVGLTSPSFPKGKGVKALNDLQRCAIDILNIPQSEVPVKVILGTYGSGKSFLSTKIAVHKVVDKEEYAKLVLIREPLDESSVKSLGALPGGLEDKIGMYYHSIIQHLDGGEFEAEMLENQGKLEKPYIGFIKGWSIGSKEKNGGALVLCDECQDLTFKEIKLIGTRLENSTVYFIGDVNQVNRQIYNSGIAEFIKKTIDKNKVAVIILDDDVRSEESKLFAEL